MGGIVKIDELEKKFRTKVKVWSKKMQAFPFNVRLGENEEKVGILYF